MAKYQPDKAFILNESLFEDLRIKKSMVHWRYFFSGLILEWAVMRNLREHNRRTASNLVLR
jgi:hypothetical protein